MSSRCRVSLLILGSALALVACQREARHSSSKPIAGSIPAGKSPDTIYPGGGAPTPLDPRAAKYDNNSPALAEGQALYTQMNGVGCHAHGGGGMGPALMDEKWRYGARIDQIAATIAEGRPNGMPAWRGKLTEGQIWQLAAYVRSMSGLPSKDAVSSRSEEMSGPTPQTPTPTPEPTNSDAAQ